MALLTLLFALLDRVSGHDTFLKKLVPENGAALINICITQVPNVTAAGLLNEVAIAIKHAVLVDFHSFPVLRMCYQMLLLEG